MLFRLKLVFMSGAVVLSPLLRLLLLQLLELLLLLLHVVVLVVVVIRLLLLRYLFGFDVVLFGESFMKLFMSIGNGTFRTISSIRISFLYRFLNNFEIYIF